ncbi:MAG TPA: adenosylcobinamide-GDP ribazoletransferase [Mycobacteriales bacterium]|jgi:adenosylcobinamide-GDP ribazoletransferase|nr:adenosylcobinamide-GDP ribazoletransferase [Mycobacteriales bacterium]
MRSALSFLTIAGRSSPPTVATLTWFPVVGTLVGLAVGGIWVGAEHAWPLVVAAAVTVAADSLLTGGLHWDGLADTGDGLLPPLSVERRLDVMRDPRVGAFGVLSVAVVIMLRFATLAAGPAKVWIVAALWCLARTAAALVVLLGRYARDEGMAGAFQPATGSRRWRAGAVGALGLVISVPLALLDRPGHGAAALGAELLTISSLGWLAHRRLGGYTGDILGAQIVLGETVGLLLWSARW